MSFRAVHRGLLSEITLEWKSGGCVLIYKIDARRILDAGDRVRLFGAEAVTSICGEATVPVPKVYHAHIH
jgi:hypothetical protein